MTYCVGILVRDGLVMIADTRTNAGLDNIATFRKLHSFGRPGSRVLTLATAGNLAVSQSVVSMLNEGMENPETGEVETLLAQPTMFRAAQMVGRAIREVHDLDADMLKQTGAAFEVSMLLGGQIEGAPPRLFMLYRAGNFIEATSDTPYLQIGEHKYGKPILDRAVTYETDLYDALKLGLISMDSTMRSNLGVGPPIELVVQRAGAFKAEVARRVDTTEPYFKDLRERWSSALRAAHQAIERPPYGPDQAS
jgi:putative proteasome-type protease